MNLYGRFRVSEEYLDLNKDDRILSIGCKDAEFESELHRRGFSVLSLDKDWTSVQKAMMNYTKMIFLHGDVTDLHPIDGESFDKIIFLETLEHIPKGKEPTALKEIHRLLKKDGILVMSVPNDNVFTTNLDPAYWIMDHRHYTIDHIRWLLILTNFEIEEEYIGGGIIEAMWIPLFYFLRRFKLDKNVKFFLDKIIDLEYKIRGFQTIIMRARKK